MQHVPHELPEAFPDKIDVTNELRASDPHFAQIADKYHSVNREIYRAEINVEPMSDFHLEDLKKHRLAYLDEIAGMISRV